MRKADVLPVSVTDPKKVEKLVEALKNANGGPLKVKEVAEKMDVSLNTAGKYVDIAEALQKVKIDRYGSVKRVWLR
jgi:Mn-dependent DtxR family transcriptional regulator